MAPFFAATNNFCDYVGTGELLLYGLFSLHALVNSIFDIFCSDMLSGARAELAKTLLG